MKGIQRRTVNDGRLIPDEHSFTIVEAVDYNGPSISKFDLEDGLFVFVPPFLDLVSRFIDSIRDLSHTSQTVAWSSPSSSKCPTTGKAPGISGIPLILGISVFVKSCSALEQV